MIKFGKVVSTEGHLNSQKKKCWWICNRFSFLVSINLCLIMGNKADQSVKKAGVSRGTKSMLERNTLYDREKTERDRNFEQA